MLPARRRIIAAIFFLTMEANAHAEDIMVSNAVAAASPTASATTGAVYFSVMNMGAVADQLLTVKTPAAVDAMLHESKDENGVMKMTMLDSLDIPAGKTVKLSPGHMHVMLTGLKKPLLAGDHVLLELEFAKAGKMTVDADVKKLETVD